MIPNKQIHIIAGGTTSPIAPHLSLAAEAYGLVGHQLQEIFLQNLYFENKHRMEVNLWSTEMAKGGISRALDDRLRTNKDVEDLINDLITLPDTKIVVLAAALCDFEVVGGFRKERFKTKNGNITLELQPAKKLLPLIREKRKDIFAVGFATTAGATEEELYKKGLDTLKSSSANLVLANDIVTKLNMVVTPEESFYYKTTDRHAALVGLVEMTLLRSHLTFTQSTVVAGEPVAWTDERIPENLRTVVNHCIKRGAYKPFQGKTAGHFAIKVDDQTFITSRRKSNFNDLEKVGMVLIETDGPDTVLAYGAKPSVGGQSQRIVFRDHPGYDCIVHAHVPIKPGSKVNIRSQKEFECGSHECGKNTSMGLDGDEILAVYLDNHGPNVVFSRNTDPQKVIDFIEENFDLTAKTGMNVWDNSAVDQITRLVERTTEKALKNANMTLRKPNDNV